MPKSWMEVPTPQDKILSLHITRHKNLTGIGLAHLCLPFLESREHVVGQDHRLEFYFRLGHVTVLSSKHVHLG